MKLEPESSFKNLGIDFQELIMNLDEAITEEINNNDPGNYIKDEYPRNYSHSDEEKIIQNMFDSLK